ncbi:hypothetical protein Plhal304r1_c035g0109391 [Plasmopara halstedii]
MIHKTPADSYTLLPCSAMRVSSITATSMTYDKLRSSFGTTRNIWQAYDNVIHCAYDRSIRASVAGKLGARIFLDYPATLSRDNNSFVAYSYSFTGPNGWVVTSLQ